MTERLKHAQVSTAKRWLKRLGLSLLMLLVVVGTAAGGFAYSEASAFDASLATVYSVAPVPFERSSDPAIIARGKHLAESLGGCALTDCHGADLAGGRIIDAGPIGKIGAPNITAAGKAGDYTDAELGRVIRHGIKKDGRGVRMMPVPEFNWLPASDITAIISYVRSVPAVQKPDPTFEVGLLGKILDRRDKFPMDIARRIDHKRLDANVAPPPSPTAEYGRFVGKLCMGCHGETFSGGPIPGAPPSMPVPLNLTPHASGLKGWTFEDFDHAMKTGLRKNGQKMADFMPREAINNMNDVEKRALWVFLLSVPAKPFGER